MSRRSWSVGLASFSRRVHIKFLRDGFPVAERILHSDEFHEFIGRCLEVREEMAQFKPPAPSRKRERAA